MNDQDQHTQPPMNGDDELAKTLSGGLQFEDTPKTDDASAPADDGSDYAASENTSAEPELAPPSLGPVGTSGDEKDDDDDKDDEVDEKKDHDSSTPSDDLEKIKSSALDELRPLVGKLSLSNEEKFDTLLLIIRSTDDQSLLQEAYDAAKGITDESKRAQALLDIIKEVDYFSSHK